MRLLDGRLDLDPRCNYRCIYCQSYTKEHGNQPWFSLEYLDRVLPILARHCWTVYLSCGGEPLMHPQFKEAMEVTKKHLNKCDVVIVTNGFLLSENKRAAILNSAITRVQISVHTLDTANYARLYGCTETAATITRNNIEALIKERSSNSWPKVSITLVAMNSTLQGIPDVARWIASTGIDGMSIQWLIPFDTPEMENELIKDQLQVIPVLAEAERILNQAGKHFEWPATFRKKRITTAIQNLKHTKNKLEYLLFNLKKTLDSFDKKTCHIAGNYLWLSKSGDIKICHRNALPIENLLHESTANTISKIKNAKSEVDFYSERCKSCPYLVH